MVHLKIGNYTNKGDGLMLHAIVERLGKKTDLTLSPLVAEYKKRAVLGLYQTLWFESLNSVSNQLITKGFPNFLRKKYGLVAEQEIDAVLDASGFAYGDQWGEKKIKTMADKAQKWKSQGKKVILLPQSLGSFQKPEVRDSFIKLLDHADLVFARDKTSYEYATGLNWRKDIIRQAPDFTGALKGTPPAWFQPKDRQACIIPNHRMIDSTNDKIGPRYLPFLKECFENFEQLGMSPFVLVHEKVDHEVALQLQEILGKKIEILYDESPLVLRGIISQCYIVVSSRFHGLISTLSQGVPCLGTRWSHKFERVMEEYGCSDYLVSPLDAPEDIFAKIKQLDEPATRSTVVESIKKTVAHHQELNNQMWEEVEKVIGIR